MTAQKIFWSNGCMTARHAVMTGGGSKVACPPYNNPHTKRKGKHSMTQKRLESKLKYIDDALTRIERGGLEYWQLANLSRTATDSIAWLWKFKHISDALKDALCDRAIAAFAAYN